MSLSDFELVELETILDAEAADRAQDDFWAFCQYMDSKYYTDDKPHLRKLAAALQLVESHTILKLMLSLPPRAGKSYTVSLWCSWLIGKHPDGSIMRNAYGDDLADKFSYDIRDIIQRDRYRNVFPDVKLKNDKAGVTDWAITEARESTYFCAGVGGAITGKGCDLVAILDDPFKNFEHAMSEKIRDKTYKWYTSTHRSRMASGCPEVQIATRWHDGDVIGTIKTTEPWIDFDTWQGSPEEYKGNWVDIVVPALDENEESFCESVKTTEEYREIKRVTDSVIWNAEYQQKPIQAEGLLYPEKELKRFALSDLHSWDGVVGYTDTADEGDDFLCSLVGKQKGLDVYITDVVFSQKPVEVTEAQVAQMLIDTNCDDMTIESNSAGKGFARNVQGLIKGRSRCSIHRRWNAEHKETRILMKAGKVKAYFHFRNDYEKGSDYDKFMKNLTSYVRIGNNTHDDGPDGVAGLAEVTEHNAGGVNVTVITG